MTGPQSVQFAFGFGCMMRLLKLVDKKQRGLDERDLLVDEYLPVDKADEEEGLRKSVQTKQPSINSSSPNRVAQLAASLHSGCEKMESK